MRWSTFVDLASRYGIEVPDRSGMRTFGDFMGLYAQAARVVRSSDDLRRLVRELAEDARADGAVWVEVYFDTTIHGDPTADPVDLQLFLNAAADAKAATGVGIGLVMAADRTQAPEKAESLARLAARHAGQGVVAFALVNDERVGRVEDFSTAFSIARSAGLRSVPHAGELGSPEAIWATLAALQPDRLGHGVRSVEDGRLLEHLANARSASTSVRPPT